MLESQFQPLVFVPESTAQCPTPLPNFPYSSARPPTFSIQAISSSRTLWACLLRVKYLYSAAPTHLGGLPAESCGTKNALIQHLPLMSAGPVLPTRGMVPSRSLCMHQRPWPSAMAFLGVQTESRNLVFIMTYTEVAGKRQGFSYSFRHQRVSQRLCIRSRLGRPETDGKREVDVKCIGTLPKLIMGMSQTRNCIDRAALGPSPQCPTLLLSRAAPFLKFGNWWARVSCHTRQILGADGGRTVVTSPRVLHPRRLFLSSMSQDLCRSPIDKRDKSPGIGG